MIRKSFSLSLAIVLFVVLLVPQAVMGATDLLASVTASNSITVVGNKISITVKGQEVKDVYAYEINIAYDPNLLEFEKDSVKAGIPGFSVPAIVDQQGGKIQFAHTKTGNKPGENGDITFGTLSFIAKKQGEASIELGTVKLVDSQLVKTQYAANAKVSVVITPPGSPSSSTSRGSSAPYVNQMMQISKGTSQDGRDVTRASIDGSQLASALSSASSGQIVPIVVQSSDPIVMVELPASALIDAINNKLNRIIQIQTDAATYNLPLSVLKNMKSDGVVTVSIVNVAGLTKDAINKSLQNAGVKSLISSPIDFNVSVNGQELRDFGGVYVERALHMGNTSINSNNSTAVWMDENNQIHFIPSVFSVTNGESVVVIRSPHNGTFTVIQSNHSFADMKDHWAKNDVEMLANKWIVNGKTSDTFAPDAPITRAEFATLLVRSLGFVETKADGFKDVSSKDWFAGAAGAAQKAGLINGYEDGTFQPDAKITREQLVSMMIRAIHAGGKEVKADASLLNRFSDRLQISDWSKEAVSQALSANLIQGMSEDTFAANENATRAQAATILKRMLQYLQFIN